VEQQTFEGFLKTVVRSGLVPAADFQTIRGSAPVDACADARSLANYLVKIGKLSRFQAAKLLEGVTLGLVLGPFHVLAPIGKGGMGAVYLARDSRNQTLVAVKVLPPKRAKAQERLLARFRREMEISQRVIHPHLTRTVEVGVHLGINYIAMEYIPGKNLHKLIHEQGPLKVPRAARMFAEVAEGLEYAHNQGLIHRDLKPSNIMVMPDDKVKVLDLGLALIQGESEAERSVVGGQGYVVGTLDYIAPEQAEDPLKVDSRSDIYSLGCTLYYALTGSTPFAGGNALQKMLRHRCDPPKPVCEINPTVPATFAVLLTRMIAKKPEMRFRSAAELRDALLPWAGDLPGRVITRPSVPVAKPPANGPGETAPVPAPIVPIPSASPAPAWAVPSPTAAPADRAVVPSISTPRATPAAAPVAAPPAATTAPAPQPIPVRQPATPPGPLASMPAAIPTNEPSAPPIAVPLGAVPPGVVVPAAIVVPSPTAPVPSGTASNVKPVRLPPSVAAPVSSPSPPAPVPAWAQPSPRPVGPVPSAAPGDAGGAVAKAAARPAMPPPAISERSSVKSVPLPIPATASPAISERSSVKSANLPIPIPPSAPLSRGATTPQPAQAAPLAVPPTALPSGRTPASTREAAAQLQTSPQPVQAKVQLPEIVKPVTPPPQRATAPASADPTEDLPFWLDYLLPVGSASLFLLVVWVLALMALWQ
jgi:serine/threonine protein kinase